MKKNFALISPVIDNLNGYLPSMCRLSLNTCHFGAIHLQFKSARHQSLNYFFVIVGDCLVMMDLSEDLTQE